MLPAMKQHGPFKDSDERREFEVRILPLCSSLTQVKFSEVIAGVVFSRKNSKLSKCGHPLKGRF